MFENMGANYTLAAPPKYKDIAVYQRFLKNKLHENDYVYITVDRLDDANAIDYIRLHYPKYLDKLIILLHESPSNLSPHVINNSKYILGNFSRNPISYEVDLKFIFGEVIAKPRSYLPISLTQGAFHNSYDMPPPKENTIVKTENKTKFFDTKRERVLQGEVDKLKELKGKNFLSFENRLDVFETNMVFYLIMVLSILLWAYILGKPVFRMQEGNLLEKIGQSVVMIYSSLKYPKTKIAVFFAANVWLLIYIFPNEEFYKNVARDGLIKASTEEVIKSNNLEMHSKNK